MTGRALICSSHTISGVMPGGAVASRHPFDARVKACAEAGYAGMCLHFRDYADQRKAGYSDQQLRDVLAANGMTHNSLEFLTDWFLEGDEASVSRSNEALAYEAAKAFGVNILNVGSDFAGRNIPADRMRARFVELCERAGRHGVSIALEIVAWSDVRDVDAALYMIDGIANAGLVVDAWHIFRGNVPLAEIERIPADWVFCVQLNDAAHEQLMPLSLDTMNRKLCGEGAFDLAGFVATLDRMGVSVPFSVEVISKEMAERELTDAAVISALTTRRIAGSITKSS